MITVDDVTENNYRVCAVHNIHQLLLPW